MTDYAELARRLRQTPRPPMHFRNRAADAIDALIKERDDLIAAIEKDAWDTAFKLQEVDNAAYERGFKDGLEKAVRVLETFPGQEPTRYGAASIIRALAPEPNQSPPAGTPSASPTAGGIDAQ
jgi:hypothetical protein